MGLFGRNKNNNEYDLEDENLDVSTLGYDDSEEETTIYEFDGEYDMGESPKKKKGFFSKNKKKKNKKDSLNYDDNDSYEDDNYEDEEKNEKKTKKNKRKKDKNEKKTKYEERNLNDICDDANDSELSSEIKFGKVLSEKATIVLGCGVLCASVLLSFLGFQTSHNKISALEAQALSKYSQKNNNIDKELENHKNNSGTVIKESEMSEFNKAQLSWMLENNIRYNEFGLPVNIKGEIVDDPTTFVNELDRAKQVVGNAIPNNTETTAEPNQKQESTSEWWKDKEMVKQDEFGALYYITKDGDTLADIAKKTGFTEKELATYNNIAENSYFDAGTKIIFPKEHVETDTSVGLG